MNNKKIGDYISTLRKEKNLTQKELADQLGVTDKAVSKWERGAGYPDISILRPLADILGTTINELLEGETSEKDIAVSIHDIDNALDYADKIISSKKHYNGKIIAALLAITLLIAIFTCVIVNVAVNHRLSWSFLVIAGCVFGGCLLIPPLLWKKRGFIISLCFLTTLIMPFLAIIQAVTLSSPWLWSLALPISSLWLAIIWLMVLLSRWKKLSRWFFLSISMLLCIPGHIITNYVVDLYVKTADEIASQITTISTVIVILTVAGVFIVIGLVKRNPKANLI